MPQFRKGDRVSVEGIVRYTPSGQYVCLETEIGNDLMVKADEPSLKLVQAKIDLQDVVIEPYGERASVVAIDGDMAWIKLLSGEYRSFAASALHRVDPEPVEPAPTAAPETPPHFVAGPQDADEEIAF